MSRDARSSLALWLGVGLMVAIGSLLLGLLPEFEMPNWGWAALAVLGLIDLTYLVRGLWNRRHSTKVETPHG